MSNAPKRLLLTTGAALQAQGIWSEQGPPYHTYIRRDSIDTGAVRERLDDAVGEIRNHYEGKGYGQLCSREWDLTNDEAIDMLFSILDKALGGEDEC